MNYSPPSRDTRPSGKNISYDTVIFLSATPIVLATYYCTIKLDSDVALFVKQHLYSHSGWSHYTSSIPDFLLLLVVIITAVAYLLYRLMASSDHLNNSAITYKILAIIAPVSYAVKSLFKYVFGRITTREWLITPNDLGFHWCSGVERYSGFPSGHMAVITALTAVLWRFQPRYRLAYMMTLISLGLALISTNYHFLSDVIAGAYLGFFVEVCITRIVTHTSTAIGTY